MPVYLEQLNIYNYRGIRELSIDFQERMNVLYGVNGAGKTSILYAIHDALCLLQCKDGIPPYFQIIDDNRITMGEEEAKLEFLFKTEEGKDCSLSVLKRRTNQSIGMNMNYPSMPPTLIPWHKTQRLGDSTSLEGDVEALYSEKFSFGSFLPGLVQPVGEGDAYEGQRGLYIPPFIFMRGIRNFSNFKKKFENLESIENQIIREKNNTKYRDSRLALFRDTVSKIIPEIEDITVERKISYSPIIVQKSGRRLELDTQLSSGEASIIYMVGQICIQHTDEEGNVPSMVLIDEVDASLHPQWQSQICPTLLKAFPHTQFIVASHSPFVWAGIPRESVLRLERNGEDTSLQPVPYAVGGYVDEIIAAYFDVPAMAPEAQREVHKVEDMFKSGRRKSDISRAINRLAERYGDISAVSNLRFRLESRP